MISADGRVDEWRFRLVPPAGQDVAKNRRHHGEMFAADASVTNTSSVTLTLWVRCIAASDANLRHADAQGMSCKRRSQGVKKTLGQKPIHSDSKPVSFKDI
jgi:hypothetical protein